MPLLQTIGSSAARAFGFTRGSANGGGAMELISTQILGSNTTTVTFSSIPQGYKHLQLRLVTRGSQATTTEIPSFWFNNVTTATYSVHYLYGGGASVASTGAANQNWLLAGYSEGASSTASSYGVSIIDILDYTNTSRNKTARSLSGVKGSATYSGLWSGTWYNTAAITRIDISTNSGIGIAAGSRLSLYGVLA